MTHTHLRGLQAGNTSITKRIEVTAENENNLDLTIAAGETDKEVAFALDLSQLKSIFISSNRAATIKTNSIGETPNTITLVPGEPFAWRVGDGTLRDTNGTAIITDVTALFITNPDEDNAVDVDVFTLIDPTI